MRLQWHNGQHHWQCGFILWIIIWTCTSWFPIEWYGGLKPRVRPSLCWCFPHLSAPTAVPGTGSELCQQSTLVKWRCDTCLGIARRWPSGCILHLHAKLDLLCLVSTAHWCCLECKGVGQLFLAHLRPLTVISVYLCITAVRVDLWRSHHNTTFDGCFKQNITNSKYCNLELVYWTSQAALWSKWQTASN